MINVADAFKTELLVNSFRYLCLFLSFFVLSFLPFYFCLSLFLPSFFSLACIFSVYSLFLTSLFHINPHTAECPAVSQVLRVLIWTASAVQELCPLESPSDDSRGQWAAKHERCSRLAILTVNCQQCDLRSIGMPIRDSILFEGVVSLLAYRMCRLSG